MRAVVQRVSSADVKIRDKVAGAIDKGLMVLLGISHDDTIEDVKWLSGKIVQHRIFADEEGKMNRSVKDIQGNILLISQFTLHASTKKGNRPSFMRAAPPSHAIPLYEACIQEMSMLLDKQVQTGEFGAEMNVSLTNDGPVTILFDTKNKE